jgi:hypothetical protein
LTLTLPSNSSISRELATLVKRGLEAIGLRTDIRMTLFQDALKEVMAGRTTSEAANNCAPFIPLVARLGNWFVQPWISGFSPPVIQTHWKYMDVDVARQLSKRRGN